MCNLYSITTNQAAIIALFRVINRYVGNLPPMPGVFPDYPAPVVRTTDTGRELVMMRWGMPPPRTGGPPVTNIRNTSSPHWRCLHPDIETRQRRRVRPNFGEGNGRLLMFRHRNHRHATELGGGATTPQAPWPKDGRADSTASVTVSAANRHALGPSD
jgi:hypothetical protein